MVNLKALASSNLWKVLQENSSKELGFPLLLTDTEGIPIITTGEYPFYYNLVKSKLPEFCTVPMAFHPHKTQRHISQLGLECLIKPIFIDGEQVGALLMPCLRTKAEIGSTIYTITQKTDLERDELKDAFEQLPLQNETNIKMLGSFLDIIGNSFSKITESELTATKKISRLHYQQKISSLYNAILDIEALGHKTNDFLREIEDLKGSSIIILNHNKRYSTMTQESLIECERVLVKQVQSTGNYTIIPNISTEFSFQSIEGREDLHYSMLAFPVVGGENVLGVFILYNKINMEYEKQEIEFYGELAMKLSLALENADQYKTAVDSSVTDKLTGTYNRRFLSDQYPKMQEKTVANKEAISLLMLDIDHFKYFNDKFGHQVGDKVLKQCVDVIKPLLKEEDVFCRYGGEEFAIIMPGLPPDKAQTAARRIRASIENADFARVEKEKTLTISVGLVTALHSNIPLNLMIKEADENLYKSKDAGRNRMHASVMLDQYLPAVKVEDKVDKKVEQLTGKLLPRA